MGAEFGHRFHSQFANEQAAIAAEAVWAERLAGLSVDEIKIGVDALPQYARNHDGWPPGAAEFRALCRPHREPYERPEFQQRALQQKTADPETARHHLDKIKGIVNERTEQDTGTD